MIVCKTCGNRVTVEGKTTHYYYCDKCKKAVDWVVIKSNKGVKNGKQP